MITQDTDRKFNLYNYYLKQCVEIPADKTHLIPEMESWCLQQFGERRPGDILMEAMEGHIDYFDGDWCIFQDYWSLKNRAWFANKADLEAFLVTWI
jgi:hypothetical protein